MPKEGSTLKFQDEKNQFKVPFIMYTDFKAILKPMEGPSPNPENPYTKEINQHIPSGFHVEGEFAYGNIENPLKTYRGEDCIKMFCDYIKNEARRLFHMFPEKAMKHLTHEEWRKFNRAKKCHICFKGLKEDNLQVRDYCHYTGQYRGPTHRICSLRYKIRHYILIVFHNLWGYDAHLFVREVRKKIRYGEDRCDC